MITLYNPTSNDVHITYKGTNYNIAPESKLHVSEEVAEFWTKVHQFLQSNAYVQPVKAEAKKTKSTE